MLPERHPFIYKILKFGFRFVRPFLPKLKAYYDIYKSMMPDSTYNAWSFTNKNLCLVEKPIKYKPLISIIVPIFNPPHNHLLEMVYSVTNQHYENWELLLVNASNNPSAQRQTKDCAGIDTRIKIIDVKNNTGISGNTNAGIRTANGEYIAFLDHDDLLHPCALHSVVEALQISHPADLIYTDEDKITDDSNRYFSPHCKPDWSPDLMHNVNYINHLSIVRAKMLNQVGGLRSAYDGAQDYELLLRIIDECNPTIKHVPRVLYHWRATDTSTAKDIRTKSYIFRAGTNAVNNHIKRNKISATVSHIAGKPGFYKLTYKPTDFSVIIDRVALSKEQAATKWLKELFHKSRITHESVELIVGEWYKKYSSEHPNVKIRYVPDDKKDYWQAAADIATYPVAVCFKMAALPRSHNSLAQLAAVAADSRHTAVAPIILGGSGTILDSGVVGSDNLPKKLFEGYKIGKYTYMGNTDWVRNVNDLTTNIVAISTERLRQLIRNGVRSYHRADTLLGVLPGCSADGSHFVVWAHTLFEYKGMLRPSASSSYHNSQLFKFTPTVIMHIDNWGSDDARKPEA